MEKTKTEIVARLKAELVNEITFITVEKGYNRTAAPYTYEYKAKAALKVGNVVKEVEFREDREYENSGYTYSWGLTDYSKNEFKDLEAAGIEIDFSEVIALYTGMVEKAKKHQEKIKKEEEIAKVIRLKEKYKTSWPLKVKESLYSEKEKNKTLIAKRDEVVITPCTEESFVRNNGSGSVSFTYRGFTTKVENYSDKLEWRGAYEGKEYQRINDGKHKRSIHILTLLLKFIEAVDDFITSRDYVKKRDNQAAIERREHAKLLSELSGHPVTIMKKRQYSRHHGRGGRESWMNYTYKLLTEIEKDRDYESSYKGFNINTSVKTVYKDGENVEVPNSRTFSIDGMSGLTEKQFKGILDLLLEDTKVITATKKSEYIDE